MRHPMPYPGALPPTPDRSPMPEAPVSVPIDPAPPRRPAWGRCARAALAVGVLVLTPPLATARAQAQPRERPLPPSRTAPITSLRPSAGPMRYGALGMLVGAVLGAGNYVLSDRGRMASGCKPLDCALPFLMVSGGFSGLFLGRELDVRRRALAPRAGEVLAYRSAGAPLPADAAWLDVRDTLVAVATDSGAQLLASGPPPVALRRRGVGLPGMRRVALRPEAGTVVFGTATALWETPLVAGPAARLGSGAVDALAVADGWVASASGALVQFRRGRAAGGDGTDGLADTVRLPAPVEALHHDAPSGAWWAAAGGALYRVAPGGGAPARVTALPGSVRGVASTGAWVAMALGDGGAAVWPREALGGEPRVVRGAVRFAYDVALEGTTLFVAGGADGVWRVALGGAVPVVEGSIRQVQFASQVRVAGGAVWVTDRDAQRVVRLVR